MEGLKRFILWDYQRGSWQYDVMAVLILLFIFATPRTWFRDQPRENQIELLSTDPAVYLLEPRLLEEVPETERTQRASQLVKGRWGKLPNITKVEPIYDGEQELIGYKVLTAQSGGGAPAAGGSGH
ncbi:MAG TPA: hypothetical protein VGL53_22410 [Bryobacteraceae bacterium]